MYEEVLSPKLGNRLNAVEERLVLYNIVSGLEVKLEGILSLSPLGDMRSTPCLPPQV